jgi:hypothetical protein
VTIKLGIIEAAGKFVKLGKIGKLISLENVLSSGFEECSKTC